jgi:hypothetical protein
MFKVKVKVNPFQAALILCCFVFVLLAFSLLCWKAPAEGRVLLPINGSDSYDRGEAQVCFHVRDSITGEPVGTLIKCTLADGPNAGRPLYWSANGSGEVVTVYHVGDRLEYVAGYGSEHYRYLSGTLEVSAGSQDVLVNLLRL